MIDICITCISDMYVYIYNIKHAYMARCIHVLNLSLFFTFFPGDIVAIEYTGYLANGQVRNDKRICFI